MSHPVCGKSVTWFLVRGGGGAGEYLGLQCFLDGVESLDIGTLQYALTGKLGPWTHIQKAIYRPEAPIPSAPSVSRKELCPVH